MIFFTYFKVKYFSVHQSRDNISSVKRFPLIHTPNRKM